MTRGGYRRFAYRLARELKQVNVDRMLRQLSWGQFMEWVAFYEAEPFGWEYEEIRDRRDSVRAASIATMIANVNRDVKKHRQPYKIEDFMIDFGAAQKPQRSTEELLTIAHMWVGAFAATGKKG